MANFNLRNTLHLYAIIDIETTGNGIKGNKITEISIFKFDGQQIVDEFTSLVNPQCPIPYFITGLTGIDDTMVQHAPTFRELAPKILDITTDCIFIAHSVNFDYGVIKEEFRHIGVDFVRKKLCTVRLSRRLIPGLRSYSLGKLCSSIGIPIENRHRARGDAQATVTLFQKLLKNQDAQNVIGSFLNGRSQEATLPPLLPREKVNALPQKPGIYYFKNSSGVIIYVGKAINIKKRVLGHFYDKSKKELLLCQETADIDFELSGNELVALLMESEAIKRIFPKYNRAQKRVSRAYSIFQYEDRNGYVHLAYGPTAKSPQAIKIFYNQHDCRTFLKNLCEQFNLCEKFCHLRQSVCETGLAHCEGACQGILTPDQYNKKVKTAIGQVLEKHESYYIKEKGRTAEEQALVCVLEGVYHGYAFIDTTVQVNTWEDLEAYLIRQKNTVETESIIAGYLMRNTSTLIYGMEAQLSEMTGKITSSHSVFDTF